MEEIREDYQLKIKNGEVLSNDKVPFICKEHGEYWQSLWNHFNHGCPECGTIRKQQKLGKLRNTDYSFMEEIREDYQIKIRNSEIGSHTKVPFICKEHGEYWQSLISHSSGRNCPKCSREKLSNLFSKKDLQFMDEIRPDYQEKIKNGGINNRTKVPFWCDIHKEYYWQTIWNHTNFNGCPICNKEKLSKNANIRYHYFLDEVREDYRSKIIEGKITGRTKIPFICPIHGEYLQTPEGHILHPNCHRCTRQISKAEKEVYNFIKKYYPNAINNSNNLLPNSKKELDIYIPELNIGIEYNGLIWHSEKFSKIKYNLLNKTNEFNSIGIHVIHILENEWINNKELTKQKLLFILENNNDINKFNEIFKFNIDDNNYIYADLRWIPLNNNIYDINGYKRNLIIKPKCYYIKGINISETYIDNYYKLYDCGYIKYEKNR
jgi:hypothetical protein